MLENGRRVPSWARGGFVVVACVAVAGCYKGAGGDDGGGGGDDGPAGSICEDGDDPSSTPLTRLSKTQYENTLRDLLGPGAAGAAFEEIGPLLADMPEDGDGSTFQNMDNRISQRHINTFYGVADTVAGSVSADSARLADLAGDCANAAQLDATCVNDFIRTFGLRVYRRPLTDAEVTRYENAIDPASTPADAYREVIFSLLMAPQFVYHVEVEGDPIDGRDDYFQLEPYEVASRLSYHFWQSMPDDYLFAAAADGSIVTDDGFIRAVDYIFEEADQGPLEDSIQRFYVDWFRVDAFGGFTSTPAFEAFAQGENVNVEGHDHYADMAQEIDDLTRHYTWEVDGTVADLLLSDISFTQSPDLAALYGVSPWDGVSDFVRFPAGERAGLLNRGVFLVTGDERTNPVHRGAFIRKDILCDELAKPDPNALPDGALDPPEPSADQTTREAFTEKTSPTECQGCHAQFNDIGFAEESFDALGRVRTQESIYDVDGQLLATPEVDTVSVPRVDLSDDAPVSGPVELMQRVADSGKVEACFAGHYFRYTYRREQSEADECAVEELTLTLTMDGGGIKQMMREIALQPQFRRRRVEP